MGTFLIIGASSGIGQNIAQLLADEGNQVIGTYHSHEPLEKKKGNIHYHAWDVMDDPTTFDFLPDVLDGIIYCPGSILLKPFDRIKPNDFIKDYQLQVVGAIHAIQQALPRLKKSKQASIILFSTVAVGVGMPYHSQVAASKGAIEGLTKALAAEMAPNIRVNCIAPSLVDSPLASQLLNTEQKREANAQRHPLKRIGTTTDIAQLASFLLSDKASWITGQILHIDGGLSTLKV
jgi:NAD(P)-dependent dehydrogenase (short-subunit alcohol dehydrogenase family)